MAKAVSKATVTAKGNGFSDSVQLNAVANPTLISDRKETVNYGKKAVVYTDNLQKIVAKYPHGSADVPSYVKNVTISARLTWRA